MLTSDTFNFRLLQTIGAPMSLRKFPSGACVLQLNGHRDEEVAKTTSEMVNIIFKKISSFKEELCNSSFTEKGHASLVKHEFT